MADQNNNVIYDENNIRHLDTITAIRMRVDMYLDGVGEVGLFKADCEPVQNLIDEFLVGRGTTGKITYNSDTGYMCVEDDGSGIPIGKLEDIFTKAHTGGKFDRTAYRISGGKNGIGTKATNAVSKYLRCEVYRLGYTDSKGNKIPPKHAIIEFEKGIRTKDVFVEDLPETSTKHGTKIEYYIDEDVMKSNKRNVEKFKEYLETSSYINSGILLEYNVDGKKFTYQHFGGLLEFLDTIIKRKKIHPIIDPITISGEEDNFFFEIAMTYHGYNTGDSNIMSAVNGFKTAMHGNHVMAMRAGAALALTEYIKNNDNLIPKQLKDVNISGTLISDNLVAIISVKHNEPLYTGQTKDKFMSDDVIEPIKRTVKNAFSNWLINNPNQAKKLVNLCIDYAKYEEERKKLKKNLIESKVSKSAFGSNSIDPTKYTRCRSNNPEERELFIVEGDSAGGNVILAQDRQFQALYCLTGKILNVVNKNKNNLSKVILELIQALGIGLPGGKLNYDNLQYYKIIILTDADDDGAHIATLLLAFIFTFYPRLIEEGRVFIANPPLKKLTMSNGKYFYIHTENDYDRLMRELIVNTFELHSERNGMILSPELFKEFIYHCQGYDILLENHAKSLSMRPELLEDIVVNINSLSQCTDSYDSKYNKEFYKNTGYKVKAIENGKYYIFDKGIYHANLKFDEAFIDHHFDIICNKLNEIMIYGMYLKGIKSGKEYHGTIYQLMKIMQSILGPKVMINRFKGLGEMEIEDLSETVINPMTRMLTQVTMEYKEKAERAMKIFMSDQEIKFKRLFYAGEVDFA